jgi:hypothetical protein
MLEAASPNSARKEWRYMFAGIGGLLAAAFCLWGVSWLLWEAIRTGRVWAKTGSLDRKLQPFGFWMYVYIWGFGGLGLSVMVGLFVYSAIDGTFH